MSLEWDTTFGAMYIGCGIKDIMTGNAAITVYKGTQPDAIDITNNWSNYKSGSTDYLAHYVSGLWTQQPIRGNLLGLSTVPAAAVAAQTGDASWAIVWMTNISQVQCDGSTLPHVAFAVVPCSSIAGNGVVRFENVTFTSGVAKAITEATIETN